MELFPSLINRHYVCEGIDDANTCEQMNTIDMTKIATKLLGWHSPWPKDLLVPKLAPKYQALQFVSNVKLYYSEALFCTSFVSNWSGSLF